MNNDELKALIKSLGISVRDLALELDMRRTSLYRYINGEAVIPKKVELAIESIERRINESKKENSFEKITLLINSVDLDKNIFKELGDGLKQVRKAKSMHQKDIAELTKLSMPYLSDLELGKSKDMTLSTIQKMAKALKIKIEILFEYQESVKEKQN